MASNPKHKYTLEEYLALERESDTHYEYWDGEIFAMSGAKVNHNRIAVNVCVELSAQLRDGPCEVFNSEQRLKVPAAPPYRYPDASVACGEPQFEDFQGMESLINPVLIVEVLSPTTEQYDQGRKFDWYKSIPTFREYLLIDQDRVRAIQWMKETEDVWIRSETNDVNAVIVLSSINCSLALNEVYRRVKFPQPTPS